MNGLNYFLLQLKYCMMEAAMLLAGNRGGMSTGDSITTTRVEVGVGIMVFSLTGRMSSVDYGALKSG